MDLEDIRDKLHQKHKDYKIYETILTYIYYALGGSSTILLIVSSVYNATTTFDISFYLILTATILNTIIAFYRVNEKTSQVHSYSSDVYDVSSDIMAFLQSEHTQEEELLFKKMILQIKKRLTDREPGISPCFSCCL